MAGAAMFVALVTTMGVWAYQLGTRDAGQVPVIRAMEGPSRIQPAEPGGVQAAHQGLEVNNVLAGEPAPAPRAGQALPYPDVLTAEDGPQGELVIAAPGGFSLPETADGGGDLRVPMQEEVPGEFAAIVPEPLTPPVAGPSSLLEELGAPSDAAAPTERRPVSRPANLAVARAAPAAPAAPSVAAPAPAAPPAAAASPAPTPREVTGLGPGTRLVQLGAYDNEALARQAWSDLVGRHGDLLGSKSLYLERATNNARVFYRLRVAGFETADQTRVLCETLRTRSVDCIPVTLQ